MEWRNPSNSAIPEWLQEFREILVDDEIPLQGSSSFFRADYMQREVRIWVSTVFILISLKTEIARSVNGPKLEDLHAEERNGEAAPRAENFGDLITADQKVLSDNCESRNNHRYAVVVQDLATQWIQAYPCKTTT